MFHSSKPAGRPRRPAIVSALALAAVPMLLVMGEAQAQGAPSTMGNMPGMSSGTTQANASGVGTVNSVDPAKRKVNLSHEPIPAISWPSMTMDFQTAPSVDLSKVKPGSKVRFTLNRAPDGTYTVESINPAP